MFNLVFVNGDIKIEENLEKLRQKKFIDIINTKHPISV